MATKINGVRAREMVKAGATLKEMAAEFDVTESAVSAWKKANGLTRSYRKPEPVKEAPEPVREPVPGPVPGPESIAVDESAPSIDVKYLSAGALFNILRGHEAKARIVTAYDHKAVTGCYAKISYDDDGQVLDTEIILYLEG